MEEKEMYPCKICKTPHPHMSGRSRCQKKCKEFGGPVDRREKNFHEACRLSKQTYNTYEHTYSFLQELNRVATNHTINNYNDTKNINSNNIFNYTININNNFNSIPEWYKQDANNIAQKISNVTKEALNDIFKLLASKQIDTKEKIIQHINDNTFTFEEIQKAITKNVSDESSYELYLALAQILRNTFKRETNQYTEAVWQFYKRVFLQVHPGGKIELEDLSKRTIRINKTPNSCDILESNDQTSKQIVWVKRHWKVLINELLHKLGMQLFKALPKFYELFGIIPTKDSIEKTVKVNGLNYIMHPFHEWWLKIERLDDLEKDSLVEKLVKKISNDLIDDCKNDLVLGWHALIEYNVRAQLEDVSDVNEITLSIDIGDKIKPVSESEFTIANYNYNEYKYNDNPDGVTDEAAKEYAAIIKRYWAEHKNSLDENVLPAENEEAQQRAHKVYEECIQGLNINL